MGKIFDENEPREQASFRKRYLTVDHIETVNWWKNVLNSIYPFASDTLTIKKHFDSIEHEAK